MERLHKNIVEPSVRRSGLDEPFHKSRQGGKELERLKSSKEVEFLNQQIREKIDQGVSIFGSIKAAIQNKDQTGALHQSEALAKLCANSNQNELFRACYALYNLLKQESQPANKLEQSLHDVEKQFKEARRKLSLF